MNALAFIGTNFFFSKLMDHSEKERKRHDLALEKVQRACDKWNEDIMKLQDSINKRLPEKKKQGNTSTMLMKQCLSTVGCMRNK